MPAQRKTTKTITKKPTSRVGGTKLAKKSFFKGWMAIPAIALVAVAGYFIVSFSQASSCRANTCWGPKQFMGASRGSIRSAYGKIFWQSSRDNDGRISVAASEKSGRTYCILGKGGTGRGQYNAAFVYANDQKTGKVLGHGTINGNSKGDIFGCFRASSSRSGWVRFSVNTATGAIMPENNPLQIYAITQLK